MGKRGDAPAWRSLAPGDIAEEPQTEAVQDITP
jgi:hypothetical protein